MKNPILTLIILLLNFSAFSQDASTLANNYLQVKNALVVSNSEDAAKAIKAFQEKVKNQPSFTQKNDLLKAVNKMADATDIEKQRVAFNQVSTLMWTVVKNADQMNETFYYQYCPMKKAYWLSNEPAVKNPYYGSSMLTCGKVVETNK